MQLQVYLHAPTCVECNVVPLTLNNVPWMNEFISFAQNVNSISSLYLGTSKYLEWMQTTGWTQDNMNIDR